MIEIIFEILSNFIDWYQNFMGAPEGITYALFGSKKKKKAKRELAKALKTVSELSNEGIGDDELGEPSTLGEGVFGEEDGSGVSSTDVPYKPSFPYTGRQIIIDSGRVHLNAKDDFILLMSKKSISLSSQGSVNIDSNSSFVVNSNRIKLGMDATEPLVLGNKLAVSLKKVGRILKQSKKVLKDPKDGQGTTIPEVQELTALLESAADILIKDSLLITSTKNFTE